MKRARPPVLSRRRVQQILSRNKSDRSAGDRIEVYSRQFLGHRYQGHSLIGSADEPEVFTVSLDAFDCVTYVEVVLALSLASNAGEFAEWVRKIRYSGGLIAWKRRNHYMTQWIRNNTRIGVVRRVAAKVPSSSKLRVLDAVPGLPARRTRFECIPKGFVPRLAPQLKTGDLIFFVSTRKSLDVFHCGLLVNTNGHLQLRHASRSRGAVVEQDLAEFLKNNRMAGVMIVRPGEERNH